MRPAGRDDCSLSKGYRTGDCSLSRGYRTGRDVGCGGYAGDDYRVRNQPPQLPRDGTIVTEHPA